MSVIVFALRGCPVGCLGFAGNEWVGTPHLDGLAAAAVVFDAHVGDCPDAAAARAAWRTGRHQVPEPNPPTPFPKREGGAGVGSVSPPFSGEGPGEGFSPPAPDLLNDLRAAGVHAILVRANYIDTDVPGFDAGWAEVVDARPQADDDSPLDELTRQFPALLDRLAALPRWLVWVETDRLLPPWDVNQEVFEAYLDDSEADEDEQDEGAVSRPAAEEPDAEDFEDEESDDENEDDENEDDEEDGEPDADDPDDEPEAAVAPGEPAEPATPWADPPVGPFDPADLDAWDWLHTTHAAVVTALDAELGRLFDLLKERGLDGSAAWVVTSDFGWPLGEHGQVGPHRPLLHEEFVHVPLVVRLPGGAEGGRRVPALTQPADLAPTLRELCGLPAGEAGDGVSLLPLARGEVEAVRPHALSGLVIGEAGGWAVRTPEWALLTRGDEPPLLFAKPDDRWEVNDVRQHHADVVEELSKKLTADEGK